MLFFNKVYDQVMTAIPGEIFYAQMQEDWGSHNSNHRMLIRKALLEYLKQNHPSEVEDSIWDLESPPVLKTLKVSISHCHKMGGFVVCSRPVGFDVEETSRITPRLLERITTEEERKRCPEPEILWTAKESIFKCVSQYVMITQIHVDSWAVAQNETFFFTSLGVQGWGCKTPEHTYALTLKKG